MAEVKVDGLVKRFGKSFVAVNKVEMTIADGEFVFLLGPSGCGKTTTLRMIAGLEMPTEGRITIDGRNVTFLRPRNRNVGMVFQDYGLYRHMTVFENIAYPLRVRKLGAQDIQSKVSEVSRTLHIEEVLQRMPDQLSAGQLQRVAIARMLVRDANVFLMDEPMSHLDAQLRAHMRTELKHLQRKIGTTTIFVTHDQLEAMTMADRIIVMKDGVIQQFAPPQDVFERPENLFVATFVGEPQMNVLPCNLVRSGKSLLVTGNGFEFALDSKLAAHWEKLGLQGRQLKLGVRPEHIGLPDKPVQGESIRGDLLALEATGTENLLTLRIGDELVTARIDTKAAPASRMKEGSQLAIRPDPSWLYLFDAETGETLAQAVAAEARRKEKLS
jgi:multiple sugar transport system ATP-binding protein